MLTVIGFWSEFNDYNRCHMLFKYLVIVANGKVKWYKLHFCLYISKKENRCKICHKSRKFLVDLKSSQYFGPIQDFNSSCILPFCWVFYVRQAIKTAVRDLVNQSNRPNIINNQFYDCCSNINCRLSRSKKALNINFT